MRAQTLTYTRERESERDYARIMCVCVRVRARVCARVCVAPVGELSISLRFPQHELLFVYSFSMNRIGYLSSDT